MGIPLIRDGFTLDGKIDAVSGLYPDVKFRYRPVVPDRFLDFLKERKDTSRATVEADARLIVEHVVEWDEAAAGWPLTAENVAACPHPVRQILLNHVACYQGSTWADKEKNSPPG